MREPEEFYVGYLPHSPPRLAARTRRVVGSLLAGGVVLAAGLALAQRPFPPSVFEYGKTRELRGVVSSSPYPTLAVPRPEGGGNSRYLLVGPGKHGAGALLDGQAGHILLRGTLAYHEGSTLVEVEPGSLELLPRRGVPAEPAPVPVGEWEIGGEIVDSKCYLGVMNPGRGKPHRACAVRCISGGIPPMLVARDGTGTVVHLLLVGPDGGPLNREVLPFVGEPVRVRGTVERLGDEWLMRTDGSRIHPVER